MRPVSIIPAVLASILFLSQSANAQAASAKTTVELFYTAYLACSSSDDLNACRNHVQKTMLPFSSAYKKADAKNYALCKKYTHGELCGNTDSNPYMSADYDRNLRFDEQHFAVSEPQKGHVIVQFWEDVSKKPNPYNFTHTFHLIRENNQWVVDDISYGKNQSERTRMQKEDEFSLHSEER